MAEERESPYVWVTWLAKVMSGDISCQWQSWFRSHYKLIEEHPSYFDSAEWNMNHTKLLTELKEKLVKEKCRPEIEKRINYYVPNSGAVISGKADCIVVNKDTVIVYDCKTGKEKGCDQVQVMLYMYLLSVGEFSGKQIKGVLIYNDKEIEIPNLSENFVENFNFFIERLISSEPLMKNPGDDCKYCKIAKSDCLERV